MFQKIAACALVIALFLGATQVAFGQNQQDGGGSPQGKESPQPGPGTGKYVIVNYPASTAEGELSIAVTYTLWIPDGVKTLRGVIVHQHGAGTTASKEGSTASYDLHWQALAKKWDCALLGSSYHVLNEKTDLTHTGGSENWFDPRRGSDKVFLKALGDLAAKSGQPEVATVPWVLWGHSGGGIWSDVLASLHPERVVAIWLRSGSARAFLKRPEFAQPKIPEAMYSIPMMCNAGVKEQGALASALATFKEYRAKGTPIGIAPDPRTGHECGDSRYLAIPFLDACLAMRLPDKGSKDQTLKPVDKSQIWLASPSGDVAQPAGMFKGDPKEAVWLPNEAVAKAWMDYVKTGAVSDTTPPPAPFNVKATAKADKGSEIVWSAEADFESGIRCFIVLRDGQKLAQVPKMPAGKYGRPLFQCMTYHDTPSKPLPEMRYVDASAKPGEKHVYTVISVNSVGLKSEPSSRSGLKSEPSSKSGLKSEPSSESATAAVQGKSPQPVFEGEKTKWHGFDRYDFLMDEKTFAVTPTVNKGKGGAKGQRACIVVMPKTAAPGNPWSWQACYWDHEPQAEVELLKRGFHIVFIAPEEGGQTRQSRDKAWDAWYKHLTEKHGFAKRAAFVGMSKGGVNEYNWGLANPEKVACIYADNPALWDEDFGKLSALAKHDVPLLHVCGSEDFLLDRYTRVVEDTYHSLGGLITVITKDGHAHHRHSLQNPKLIADWIEQHMTPSTANKPAFVDGTFTKAYYYSLEPKRIFLKEENSYATARGPGFTECYDRYDGPNAGKTFKKGGISIIVPKTVAPGKPWVFTGDFLERDATVEQALLAKGYHILMISPLESGFTQKQWNDTYKLLVDHGFSKTPVLKGTGPKAGEAYGWAVANPDKVSCIYARNPLMKSIMAGKQQPMDNLGALAKAGVPVLHDSGATDPWLDSQTRVVEKRYKDLGGKFTVIVRDGEGHFPLSPKDPKSVVEFIIKNDSTGAAQPKKEADQPKKAADQPKKGGAPEGVEVLRDVVVGTGSGRDMRADIARPKTPPAGLMPAVIWIHGGGWTTGSHHDFQQTIQLAKHGYLVLSVEYRFPKEAMWPAQIEDCKLAVRWLRANAAKYNVDPDRIGCWGTSAGGHLAALMGVTADRPELEGKGGSEGFSSTVQAVVNFCGPTKFNGTAYIVPVKAMAGGTFEEKPDLYKQMSPLDNVNPKAPPFLFVNGEKDTVVPVFHAERMVEALKKVNVPAEMIVVKNAGHGYVFNGSKDAPAQPSPREVDAAVLKFLDANLKKK